MVRLTLNKPYTLHARSIDRITGTPSDYKLNLKDPITCARHADRHADLSSRRSVTRIARHGDDHRCQRPRPDKGPSRRPLSPAQG